MGKSFKEHPANKDKYSHKTSRKSGRRFFKSPKAKRDFSEELVKQSSYYVS